MFRKTNLYSKKPFLKHFWSVYFPFYSKQHENAISSWEFTHRDNTQGCLSLGNFRIIWFSLLFSKNYCSSRCICIWEKIDTFNANWCLSLDKLKGNIKKTNWCLRISNSTPGTFVPIHFSFASVNFLDFLFMYMFMSKCYLQLFSEKAQAFWFV